MSTAPVLLDRPARAARRSYLTGVLAQVTRELLELDRADRRIPTIVEPTNAELIPYDKLATRNQRVRAWAADHGYQLNPRGRLPKSILEQYATANPDDTEATP